MLGPEEQERFSRHLLLDHLGGRGQERLCAGEVTLDLPARFWLVAQSCARALAAAGVGRLLLRGPWAGAALRECRRLAPGAELVSEATQGAPELVSAGHQGAPGIVSSGHQGTAGLVSPAHQGGRILVSIGHQAAHGSAAVVLSPLLPGPAAEQAALGALAALEALKLLADTGRPAPSPLEVFPRSAP